MKYQQFILAGLAFATVACTDSSNSSDTVSKQTQKIQHQMSQTSSKQMMKREMNFSLITRGGKIFQQNCAVCHGMNAEGQKNWRQRNSKDQFPAPPLNGTGHAWHHSNEVNANTIRNGTKQIGGNMPAWKDKLSDDDIDAVIAWFQSNWPDNVYQTWAENIKNPKYKP